MHLYFSIVVMEKLFCFNFRETATLFPILMLYFQLYLQPTHLRPTDEDRKPDKRDSPIQHHQGKDKATPVQSLDQSQ